jgi:hypothetical protein
VKPNINSVEVHPPVAGCHTCWFVTKEWKFKKLKIKKWSDFGKFSIARSEGKTSKNCKILI